MEIDITAGLFDPALLDYSDAIITNANSYDGAWCYCGSFERIRFSVYADILLHAHLEFSLNAADIDAISATWVMDTGDANDYAVYGRYARIIVVNDIAGVDTTTTRIRMYGAR